MKINTFSIYDEKAQAFNVPFFQTHVGQAIRSFSDLAKDPQSTISRHPEDYHLYHIGEFDDHDAKIVSFNEPRLVARATEFFNHVKPVEVPASV